jgi:hypothetical protein
MRTQHFQVSVGGLLSWPSKDLKSASRSFIFTLDDGRQRRPTNVREFRAMLVDLLDRGVRYLPLGAPCPGWTDADGCPGHEEEDPPACPGCHHLDDGACDGAAGSACATARDRDAAEARREGER